jgi:hypothetical protein
LQPVLESLRPIGATVLLRKDDVLGADIAPLQKAGVPGFAPLVDLRHYFDYHHTAADTRRYDTFARFLQGLGKRRSRPARAPSIK